MNKTGGKKGFTLVELSLAVAFLALLSLTITLIINDTVATYRRGLTLNEITTTGMDLVDDMRAAVQNAPAQAITYECESLFGKVSAGNDAERCVNDAAKSLVVMTRTAEVDTDWSGGIDDNEKHTPVYGAICTGSYSYIWNSGYFFGQNNDEAISNSDETRKAIKNPAGGDPIKPASLTYSDSNGGVAKKENFRLLKVRDGRRAVCKSALLTSRDDARSYKYYKEDHFTTSLNPEFNIANSSSENGVHFYINGLQEEDIEVVLDDDRTNGLALYDLTMAAPVSNDAEEAAFFSVSFVLGTLTGGINVNAVGNFCKTPEDYRQDFNYCAINKFNFAAQATGGK